MPPSPKALQIGEWIADPGDDSLTRGSQTVRLEPRSMRLLMRLASTPGDVVSQETLLNDVWRGVVVSPASVYQTISQLRKALGDTGSPPNYIDTVARKGYRLIATVRAVTAPASDPALASLPEAAPAPAPAAIPMSARDAIQAAPPAPRARSRWRLAAIGAAFLATFMMVGLFVGKAERGNRRDEAAASDSVVVLPIVDFTPGKTEQPFCDGLTEELSNWLAQIPTLHVVARTSAFAFRNQAVDVREIGRVLGVSHVLEGSFRRSGNVVRITMQLIKTSDGFHAWSESYDRPIGDILQLQETIAREVAARMEHELTLAVTASLQNRMTQSSKALQAYLLARHHQQTRSKESNDRAITLYENALAADPLFLLAKVGLAEAYLNTYYYDDRPMDQVAARVRPLLDDVEQRAPKLGELYVVRGALHTNLYERDAARKDFEEALRLTPNSSAALTAYARFLLIGGEPREALHRYTEAVNLDPLFFNLQAQRCQALTDLGEFEAADIACARARALQPSAPHPLTVSSDLEEARGRPAQALQYTELALRKSGGVAEIHAARCHWLMVLGLVEEARVAYDDAVAATTPEGAGGGNLLLTTLGLRTAYAVGGKSRLAEQIAKYDLGATDEPELLFDLAETMFVAGDVRAARAYSDRALASPKLHSWELTNAWYARTGRSYLVIAATVEQATGDAARAAEHLAQADAVMQQLIANGMRRHGVYLLQADIAALRGDDEAALRALRNAAELGWRDVRATENFAYFASLHRRADYRALIDRIRAQNAVDADNRVSLGLAL